MKLLENPLIQKYFGTPDDTCWFNNIPYPTKEFMAYRILQAMCEPIDRLDAYLCITQPEYTTELKACYAKGNNGLNNHWHPTCLRLHDQFQPKRDEWKRERCVGVDTPCEFCGENFVKHCPSISRKPDPVDEKIKVICKTTISPGNYVVYSPENLAIELRELVELARAK